MQKRKKPLLKSPDDFASIGEYVSYIRETRGYTLQDVVELVKTAIKNQALDSQCSLSRGYLSNLETGKHAHPSPFKLKALAFIYKIPYESLLQKAGYWEKSIDKLKQDTALTLMLKEVDDMTDSEVTSVIDYIDFVKSRRTSNYEKRPKKG